MTEDSEYREELEKCQLGELVDRLVCLRLNDTEDDADTQWKIKYVKEEISRRETGRRVEEKDGKRGIKSVSSLV